MTDIASQYLVSVPDDASTPQWPVALDGDSRQYGLDWSLRLASGETVSTSTWTLVSGITTSANSHNNSQTFINIAGGVSGEDYEVLNTVVTNYGNTMQCIVILTVG